MLLFGIQKINLYCKTKTLLIPNTKNVLILNMNVSFFCNKQYAIRGSDKVRSHDPEEIK